MRWPKQFLRTGRAAQDFSLRKRLWESHLSIQKELGVTSLNTKPVMITAQLIGYFRCKKGFGANFEKSRLIKAQHEIQHIEIQKKVSMQFLH